jgi:protease-4
MGSHAIVAQPGTITGSIGVFGGKMSLRGLYDKIGLSKEILARGEHAALFSDYRPWTEEERGRIRALMVAFYEDFLQKAAKGRGKTRDQVHEVAQGRVWTGVDAKRIGLVDYLGGLDVAIAIAKERAHIAKDQDVRLVELPERKGLLETILERQEDGARRRAAHRAAAVRAADPLTSGRGQLPSVRRRRSTHARRDVWCVCPWTCMKALSTLPVSAMARSRSFIPPMPRSATRYSTYESAPR